MNRHLTEEEFAAYIEGRVTRQERRQIEAHLACCDECLDELGELVKIWKKQNPVPVDFMEKVLGKNLLGEKRWFLQWVPTAALFLLAIFLGYQFFFNTKKSLEMGEQPAPNVAKKKDQPVAARPEEKLKQAESSGEVSSSRMATGKPRGKKEEYRNQAQPQTIQTASKGRSQVQAQYLKDEMQKMKDQEQMRSEEERKKVQESAVQVPASDQQNIQNKTVQALRQRAETDYVKPKGQLEKKNIQSPGVNWRLEGDATAADLLNPEILDSLVLDKSLQKNQVLVLEVDASGKVKKVKTGLAPVDRKEGANALILQAEKLLFSPSPKEVREIKLVFVKNQEPVQKEF